MLHGNRKIINDLVKVFKSEEKLIRERYESAYADAYVSDYKCRHFDMPLQKLLNMVKIYRNVAMLIIDYASPLCKIINDYIWNNQKFGPRIQVQHRGMSLATHLVTYNVNGIIIDTVYTHCVYIYQNYQKYCHNDLGELLSVSDYYTNGNVKMSYLITTPMKFDILSDHLLAFTTNIANMANGILTIYDQDANLCLFGQYKNKKKCGPWHFDISQKESRLGSCVMFNGADKDEGVFEACGVANIEQNIKHHINNTEWYRSSIVKFHGDYINGIKVGQWKFTSRKIYTSGEIENIYYKR
jgi:hypothetical protein